MINIEKLFPCNNFSTLEKNILIYIINNIENCTNLSIRTIAKATYTSSSTIIRLSKKLGYSGYIELVYSIRSKVCSKSSKNLITDFQNRQIFTTASPDAIDKFIEYIEFGNLFIFSTGFSDIVGEYIFKKLLVMGKKCLKTDCIELDILLDNYVEKINSVLIISKSGESQYCVSTAKSARDKNIKVISFTGNSQSSLVKYSDVSFIITDYENLDDHNFYPNPFFGYCIETFELLLFKYYSKNNKYKFDNK